MKSASNVMKSTPKNEKNAMKSASNVMKSALKNEKNAMKSASNVMKSAPKNEKTSSVMKSDIKSLNVKKTASKGKTAMNQDAHNKTEDRRRKRRRRVSILAHLKTAQCDTWRRRYVDERTTGGYVMIARPHTRKHTTFDSDDEYVPLDRVLTLGERVEILDDKEWVPGRILRVGTKKELVKVALVKGMQREVEYFSPHLRKI